MKVLLSNVGRRTYFVNYLLQLKEKYQLEIILTDTSKNTAGFWVQDSKNVIKKYILPKVTENVINYIEKLKKLCKSEKVDLLIPLMDYELLALAEHRDEFENFGTKVVIGNYDTVKIASNKWEMVKYLNSKGVPSPKTWIDNNDIPQKGDFLFKPIDGSASIGIQILKMEY